MPFDVELLLWHYTWGFPAAQILQQRCIRPYRRLIWSAPRELVGNLEDYELPNPTTGEKPMIWFSGNQLWEPSLVPDDFMEPIRDLTVVAKIAEIGEAMGGLVRFGVRPEVAPYDWPIIKEFYCRPSPEMFPRACNSPNRHDWYASFLPVCRRSWQRVERFGLGRNRRPAWFSIADDPAEKSSLHAAHMRFVELVAGGYRIPSSSS
jgi:hypothetical protein